MLDGLKGKESSGLIFSFSPLLQDSYVKVLFSFIPWLCNWRLRVHSYYPWKGRKIFLTQQWIVQWCLLVEDIFYFYPEGKGKGGSGWALSKGWLLKGVQGISISHVLFLVTATTDYYYCFLVCVVDEDEILFFFSWENKEWVDMVKLK